MSWVILLFYRRVLVVSSELPMGWRPISVCRILLSHSLMVRLLLIHGYLFWIELVRPLLFNKVLSDLGRIKSFAPLLIVSAISRRQFVAFLTIPLGIGRKWLHFLLTLWVIRICFQLVVNLSVFERIEAALIEVCVIRIILDFFNHPDCIREFILLTLSIFGSFHLLRAVIYHLLDHLKLLKLWFGANSCWRVYRYLTDFLRDLRCCQRPRLSLCFQTAVGSCVAHHLTSWRIGATV